MTKDDLIETVRGNTGCTKADAKIAVTAIFDEIAAEVAAGRKTIIRGFGTFSRGYRAGRTGRNLRTGASIDVPAHYRPHFKAAKTLLEKVNG